MSTSTLLTLTRLFCFIVPFDPKIPLFTFLSLLGINTYRYYSEKKYSLQNDPMCAAGGEACQSQGTKVQLTDDLQCGELGGPQDCTLDCEIRSTNENFYFYATCLEDCAEFPACFKSLMDECKASFFGSCWAVGVVGKVGNFPISFLHLY